VEHHRDGQYYRAFQQLIDAAEVTRVPLPPRSPNLNAYAERRVRSVKEECLSWLIRFGERRSVMRYPASFTALALHADDRRHRKEVKTKKALIGFRGGEVGMGSASALLV
jgi:transposase InsO family protein